MANILIGTSGWSYQHWKGRFYPQGLPQKKWLEFYAQEFPTIEINASFYRLPKRETFESWSEHTSDGFIFTVKASRYLTHIKKLQDPEEPLERLLGAADGLGSKLGPILYQFPGRWQADAERLSRFLDVLPKGLRHAFEFRHPSWFNEEIYELLKKYRAALVIASSPDFPSEEKITAPFVFIRMHGGQELYSSRYSLEELKEWGEKIRGYAAQGKDCYIYFNNDTNAYAIYNARELKQLLGLKT